METNRPGQTPEIMQSHIVDWRLMSEGVRCGVEGCSCCMITGELGRQALSGSERQYGCKTLSYTKSLIYEALSQRAPELQSETCGYYGNFALYDIQHEIRSSGAWRIRDECIGRT